jgi:hypothetical protein
MQSRFSYAGGMAFYLPRHTVLSIAFLGLTAVAFASPTLPTPKIQPPNVVHVTRGQVATSQIDVMISKPFHLQSNPASKSNLVPTVLEIQTPSGITVGTIQYPEGTPLRFSSSSDASETISTFQGHIGIEFSLKADLKQNKSKQLVHAKLKYQACDEKTCYRPSDVPFDFWVEIQ